jgi:hypothetical protein
MINLIILLVVLFCNVCNAAILTTQPENYSDYTEIYVSETINFLKPYSPGQIDVSVNEENVTLDYSIGTDWFIFWLEKGEANTIDVRYPGISPDYITHSIMPMGFFAPNPDTILIKNTSVGIDTRYINLYNEMFIEGVFTYPEGPLPYFNTMNFDYIFDGSLRNIVKPLTFNTIVYGVIPEPNTMIFCMIIIGVLLVRMK